VLAAQRSGRVRAAGRMHGRRPSALAGQSRDREPFGVAAAAGMGVASVPKPRACLATIDVKAIERLVTGRRFAASCAVRARIVQLLRDALGRKRHPRPLVVLQGPRDP